MDSNSYSDSESFSDQEEQPFDDDNVGADYIYLIREPIYRKDDKSTYKVGRTTITKKANFGRFRTYKSGSEAIMIMKTPTIDYSEKNNKNVVYLRKITTVSDFEKSRILIYEKTIKNALNNICQQEDYGIKKNVATEMETYKKCDSIEMCKIIYNILEQIKPLDNCQNLTEKIHIKMKEKLKIDTKAIRKIIEFNNITESEINKKIEYIYLLRRKKHLYDNIYHISSSKQKSIDSMIKRIRDVHDSRRDEIILIMQCPNAKTVKDIIEKIFQNINEWNIGIDEKIFLKGYTLNKNKYRGSVELMKQIIFCFVIYYREEYVKQKDKVRKKHKKKYSDDDVKDAGGADAILELRKRDKKLKEGIEIAKHANILHNMQCSENNYNDGYNEGFHDGYVFGSESESETSSSSTDSFE